MTHCMTISLALAALLGSACTGDETADAGPDGGRGGVRPDAAPQPGCQAQDPVPA
jgi:hypothetical protein